MCNKDSQSNTVHHLRQNSGRKKLWQLDRPLHCSVIGTCLTLEELRQLCLKLRMNMQSPLSDYELHHAFVAIASTSTYAARRLHKYLDKKYQTYLRRFAKAKSDAELVDLWQASVESGDVAGAY